MKQIYTAKVGKRYHAPAPLPQTKWREFLKPGAIGILVVLSATIFISATIGVFK